MTSFSGYYMLLRIQIWLLIYFLFLKCLLHICSLCTDSFNIDNDMLCKPKFPRNLCLYSALTSFTFLVFISVSLKAKAGDSLVVLT